MGSEHATGSPLKADGSVSESGRGFDILRSLYPTGLDKNLEGGVSAKGGRNRKGAVAQLGERLICTQEVAGSNPTSSTRVGTAEEGSTWARSSDG